jgi:hypothetical protein
MIPFLGLLLAAGAGATAVKMSQSITPPIKVPIPSGWRRATGGEVSQEPKAAPYAAAFGSRIGYKVGEFETTELPTGTWGAIVEMHHDDHVSPGRVIWHPGVSLLRPA